VSNIVFIPREKIDVARWDSCVANSPVNLPYAHTWYLDAVAQHWDGLVLNNYEAVMPVPWYWMLAVKKVYQPHYCQQGGIFSMQQVDANMISLFLNEMKKHFYTCYIHLNYTNQLQVAAQGFNLRTNLILDLNYSYEKLQTAFSHNHQRNIRKAAKAQLVYSSSYDNEAFYSFYISTLNAGREVFKSIHQQALIQLLRVLKERELMTIKVVQDSSGNWLAACLLVVYNNRFINLINTSSTAGKSVGATQYLFSQIINEYASGNQVLDFEGSSIPTIARFYEGFGAIEQPYYAYHTNWVREIKQRFL
jgi:hypothetical protein